MILSLNTVMNSELNRLLRKHWNATHFRPLQREICESILKGKDTVALLPTGGGKSLCYQLPALILKGPVLVISPLVSLMHDQVEQAKKIGIKSMIFGQHQSLDHQLDNARYGNYNLLYITPEKAQNRWFKERIPQLNISCIAIDEAHCISQWGNDFRPAYRKLNELRKRLPSVPVLALTATATPAVVSDIHQALDLDSPAQFQSSFARPNLHLEIRQTEDKLGELHRALAQLDGSAIIYTNQRKGTEKVTQFLKHYGHQVAYYHGGLSANEKTERMRLWEKQKNLIMVATTAFGMGIDKPNVRQVIHLQLPPSLENYYQEIGRAGRDGLPAHALLLYHSSDAQRATNQYVEQFPDDTFIRNCYKHLCNYLHIAQGEGTDHIWHLALNDFCKTYRLSPKKVDQCWQLFDQYGIFQRVHRSQHEAKIRILLSAHRWQEVMEESPQQDAQVMASISRKYPGVFDHLLDLDLDYIVQKTATHFTRLVEQLNKWAEQDMIAFSYAQHDTELTGLVPREDPYTLRPLLRAHRLLRKAKKRQMDAMIAYVENREKCRQKMILHYFGEKTPSNCGQCDFDDCASGSSFSSKPAAPAILEMLLKKPRSSEELHLSLPQYSKADLAESLDRLLEAGEIEKNPFEKYSIK